MTLSGPVERIRAWLESDPNAKRLPPLHPWHHPAYCTSAPSRRRCACCRVHSTPSRRRWERYVRLFDERLHGVTLLDHTYWLKWLSSPGMRRMRLLFYYRLPYMARILSSHAF